MKNNISLIAASLLSLGAALATTTAYADDAKKVDAPLKAPANLNSQVVDQAKEDSQKVSESSKQGDNQEPRRPFHFQGLLENR